MTDATAETTSKLALAFARTAASEVLRRARV